MSRIAVRPLGSGRFLVDVSEGPLTTHHKVAVSDEVLDDLGLSVDDARDLVHEAFAYLLDREPVTAIARDFPIEQPARRHPDYWDELRTRLA